uniref:Uncharacterized protein n=1 Tax=Ditylenchus dipsaci TaxID=166011 RepID=A0A915DCX8_9BILA
MKTKQLTNSCLLGHDYKILMESMQDYIHVDDDVITGLMVRYLLKKIVEEVATNDSQLADSEMGEDNDPVEPPISSLEASKAMDIVRRFAEKNFADPAVLKLSDALEDA